MKLLHRLRSWAHELVLAALLLGVTIAAAWLDPSFVALDTQLELSTHAVEILLLALPMTLIIISSGIDLSVGSTLALSAVVMGILFEAGAPMPAACAAAVAVGALAGALNGAFISRLQVHPLIVTLASLAAYRGLAEGISQGRPISGFPDSFLHLGIGHLWGVPIPLLIGIAAVAFAMILARATPFGFRTYTIGDNERAARYAGLSVDRIKMLLYVGSGVIAALAAIILVARRNTAKADIGMGIELDVITAVVLGGASINGGRGRVVGTVMGVLLIHEIREFVSWHWGYAEIIPIVTGGILIASVLLNNAASRRRT